MMDFNCLFFRLKHQTILIHSNFIDSTQESNAWLTSIGNFYPIQTGSQLEIQSQLHAYIYV